jgi:hypothetical protein
MKMKKWILIAILLFAVPLQSAVLYRWVDNAGVMHFTDDISNVPAAYRDQVRIEKTKDTEQPATPSTPQEPPKGPDTSTDMSQDEALWRARVRPLNQRLKEATENYERVKGNFIQKSEELTGRRFGSRTQIKMNVAELDQLRQEVEKCEDEIAQLKNMLKKISDEAQASGANPEWLQ